MGELHVSERGYVGLGPIGGGITTVALVVPLAALHRGRGGTSFRASFFAELGRFPGLAGRFDPKRLVREVLGPGPFARVSRRSVGAGGGLRPAGDAREL